VGERERERESGKEKPIAVFRECVRNGREEGYAKARCPQDRILYLENEDEGVA